MTMGLLLDPARMIACLPLKKESSIDVRLGLKIKG